MKMSNEELAAASSHAITGTLKVGYETRPRFLRFLRCGGLHPTPMHVPDIVVAYA